jgi:putative transposase
MGTGVSALSCTVRDGGCRRKPSSSSCVSSACTARCGAANATTRSEVLNRVFTTESRHTKWVTDVTEFTVGATKVYLSPVLDLHDNRVISATAGPSPSVKMVTDGLKTAIDTLGPEEKPLVHSDQGFQYRHTLWRDTLRGAGLTQSMSRKGTCLDNAAMEGFFSHLKEEWFRIQKPTTLDAFHEGLNDYLHWWNTTRIQERLGYLSPDEYRAQEIATA